MQAGHGLLFMDFHGDAADDLTGYVPRERFENGDVVYLNPLAERVFSLNTFRWKDAAEKELKIQSFLSTLISIHKEAIGPESQRILMAGLDAICELPSPNPLHLSLFTARSSFRRRLVLQSQNPRLTDFLQQYDNKDSREGLRPSERMSKFSPAINKTDPFTRPTLSVLLGQEELLDWKAMIDSRKIIICNLNKGRLGQEVAALIGSLILSEIWNAVLQRNTEEDNPDFYAFVDEAHNTLHSVNLGSILSESRKFRFFPFFGLQYFSQIPDMEGAFGNYSTWITCRLGGNDADALEREFASESLAKRIVNLPSFHFIARKLEQNEPRTSEMVTARKKVKKLGDEPPRGAVIGESLKIWSRDRNEQATKIERLLAS